MAIQPSRVQSVILSAAKDLARWAPRSFAALRMTLVLDPPAILIRGHPLRLGTAVPKNPALYGFRVLARVDPPARKNSFARDHVGKPETCWLPTSL